MGARIKEHPSVEIFPRRLLALRMEKKVTSDVAAKGIGICRASLGHYEIGARRPDIVALSLIADYYNVPTDYLVGRDAEASKIGWISETMERMGKTAKSMKSLHKAAQTCKQELESIIALTEQEESEENQ